MRASVRLRVLLGAALAASLSASALVACGSSGDDGAGAKDASTDGTLRQAGDSAPPADASADASAPFDAAVSDADAAAADADAAVALHRPYALTHFIATGQSLSVGVAGSPLIDTTQPYHNVRIEDDGSAPLYDGVGDRLSLVPLIAPVRPTEGATLEYPHNIFGQTCNEPAANQVTALAMAADGRDYPVALSVVGESAQSITVIEKGGTGNAYASSIYEATALVGLAADAGASFGVGGIFLTHGETDSALATYEAALVKLQADYQSDLQALTRQADGVPLFLSQQCTEPPSATQTSASTLAEWKAAVDNPGKIVLVGSKYQYEYAGDHLHLIGPGYVALGEKYGEAYFQQVVRQAAWRPLAPKGLTAASIEGAVITLTLDVAYPPLGLDPMLTTNHATGKYAAWAKGDGFEVSDSTGILTIASVAITGSTVTITLAKPPTGTALTLAYAMEQDVDGSTQGGLVGGRHGALRDSDPFVGRDAEMIAATVTAGSATITAPGRARPFLARTTHDRVHDAAGAEYLVTAHAADGSSVTVSPVWAGATGTSTLGFAHEQRNYLVQFSLPVP